MNTRAPIEKAIAVVGTSAQLARIVGVSPQAVSQWPKVPAARCLAVEAATGGEVTRYDLRPDIYGEV